MVSELGLGSGELSVAIGESPTRNKGKLRHMARAYFFHQFFFHCVVTRKIWDRDTIRHPEIVISMFLFFYRAMDSAPRVA